MTEIEPVRVGLDVGNVILRNDTDGFTQAHSESSQNFELQTQAYVDGAIDAISRMVLALSSDNAYIISKCGTAMQQHTLATFRQTDFFERTGFDPSHVYFCKKRREKAPIAAELGLSHFVDDRLDVLLRMSTVKSRMLFQRPNTPGIDVNMLQGYEPDILIMNGWQQVCRTVLNAA